LTIVVCFSPAGERYSTPVNRRVPEREREP
jgi:hypothetical protein